MLIQSENILKRKGCFQVQLININFSIKSYFKFSSAAKGGLVDSSPANLKSLNDEIEKINRQYGAGSGSNFEDLPKFEFKGIYKLASKDHINANR